MKRFPNAFVIILAVIFFAWIFTYIIPQGSYERITDSESGITRVVNNSYHHTNSDHLSAFEMLVTIPRGIIGRADLIILILLIGGCFYIIEKTGAMSQGLRRLTAILKGREVVGLILITALFTAGGATIGLQEEVIAMTPVLLLFGQGMGYNALAMVYMSFGSSVIGSSFSPTNPFAVVIAQKEAFLPLLSGSEYRLVVLILVYILWVLYLVYYTRRNKTEKRQITMVDEKLSNRSVLVLSSLCLTFSIVIYGLLEWEWGFNEMSASFFALGIFSGFVGRLGVNGTALTYIEGFKEMIFAGMILGLANSISLILKESMVLDTIVYYLFGPLQFLSPATSGVLMMVSHMILHFPLPSYSGQAILTMPVLVPLSDLIGLSRQTCVLAYQSGAVMADIIVPTNGALMAIIAISGISYNSWLRFIWRPLLLIMSTAAVAIVIAVATGYR